MPNGKRSPLLLRVMARIGDARFREAYIPRERGLDIYGVCFPGDAIVINPIPHTVDTIIHEVLHDLMPDYSEHAIRTLTGRLRRTLTEDETQTVYDEYRKRVTLSDRLQAADDQRSDRDFD